MYYTYIIYSSTLDKYYIGHTVDVPQRLGQHNSGISIYTSKANDWQLMWQQAFETRTLARECELRLKKKKSTRYLEWLIANEGR